MSDEALADESPNTPEPTTTHAEWGAGNPRLIVTAEGERFVHDLDVDELTIGSAAACGLVLPGLDALHATIHHDARDEYVLTLHGPGETSAKLVALATHPDEHSQTLRTGAQFAAGAWRFVFHREEYADHGRPYGGRQGGEYAVQRPQPPRPDYSGPDANSTGEGSDDTTA
ncbi:FHA domain-containing protein [Microbacterium amylolyticum]|uniref:FHA domain-containing protein n=1 Tax=Microbacterium amylolyticum TaxID=936337 RepID=A0ABS4ZFI9_9MICO|nr:FHA domain-containing protein [Microbacterium amylolyticum]MBP2436047.1 hypothetical protein [Microbacterium amylolyticum]